MFELEEMFPPSGTLLVDLVGLGGFTGVSLGDMVVLAVLRGDPSLAEVGREGSLDSEEPLFECRVDGVEGCPLADVTALLLPLDPDDDVLR